MPKRISMFVGFVFAQADNFQRSEPEFVIETEQDRIDESGSRCAPASEFRPRAMENLNAIFGEPVFVEIKRDGRQHDGQGDEHPMLASHTIYGWTNLKANYSKFQNGNFSRAIT